MTEAAPRPDILFIHPQGVNWFRGVRKDFTRVCNIMAPLGILSLSAYLEERGFRTEIFDGYATPLSDEALADHVLERDPPWIGFTVTTSSFLQGCRIARALRQRGSRARFVFGGVHVSALESEVLERFEEVDFGVVGEGEETLAELIESGGEGDLGKIPGLLFRDGPGRVVFTGPRPDRIDLDTLPFPAYGKLPGFPQLYELPLFNFPRGPGTTMISARGCPYKCTFCDRSVFGSSFRYNAAEYMFEHVRYLVRNYRMRHINFYDDLFTLRKKRVLAFCDMLARGPVRITFNCSAQVSHIDEELVRKLREAGCWMVSLGLETGDPELLKTHKRGSATVEKGEEALRLVRKAGLRTKGLFIAGLPGETEESFRRTAEFIRRNPLDDLNMSKFTPFPGSPLYSELDKWGTFEENWEEMNCTNFTFVPHGMTREKLDALYRDFQRSHYLRPRVWWNYVTMLWKSPESWSRFVRNFPAFAQIRYQVKQA
jgi:radical SAM superfamily enzyme YgiQ (UPF0313 family)